MNEGPVNQSHMSETTDCLEAVGVFRGWKNFFFLLVVICLLLAQACFWLVNLRLVLRSKLKWSANHQISIPKNSPKSHGY